MKRPNAHLHRRTIRGWTAPLKALVLPLVVLLLAAGYRQPEGSPVTQAVRLGPSATPAAGAVPRGGGVATELPTAHVKPPTATPEPPTPAPAVIRTPAVIPALDPLPALTRTFTPTPTRTASPTPTPIWPTPDGSARTARVPILMYHHVAVPPAGAGELRRSLSVAPAAFEQQLLFLQKEGYESISLHDLALHLTRGTPLPEKPVVITFDDGYRDNYTHAFPLLQRFGFTATFFLVTAPLDAQNPDFLSWDQVREMSRAGMAFEPHSLDHPDMRGRTTEFLVYQILASQGAIEERTGKTCRFFAYPSGRYDQRVIDVLRSANFWGAVLTEQGTAHTTAGLFVLKRVRVQPDDGLDAFAVKLRMSW